MRPYVVFTVLRLGLFVVVLGLLSLLRFRGVLLVGLAAVISLALSYVLLRGPRENVATALADRAGKGVLEDDDAAEDAEVDRLREPPASEHPPRAE